MRAAETEQTLVRTPSERENGGIGEYPVHYPPEYHMDKGAQNVSVVLKDMVIHTFVWSEIPAASLNLKLSIN